MYITITRQYIYHPSHHYHLSGLVLYIWYTQCHYTVEQIQVIGVPYKEVLDEKNHKR